MTSMRPTHVLAAFALSCLGATACGSTVIGTENEIEGDPCPGPMIDDTCIGVTPAGRCHAQAWTQGVNCSAVQSASDEASLQQRLAAASPGECIDLARGEYGDHLVPDGVSILGRGWDCVSMGSLTMAGTSAVRGARVRGVTADQGGHLELRELWIEGGSADGIQLLAGTSANLQHVTLNRSSRYAVAAFDSGSVSLEATFIHEPVGPGVWFQCGEMAGDCQPGPDRLTLRSSQIVRAAIVGLSAVNADAVLDDVDIVETTVGENFEGGVGLSLASSRIEATGLRVRASYGAGVLCFNCDGSFGAAGQGRGVVLDENLRGFWAATNEPAMHSVSLTNATLSDNSGMSVSVLNDLTAVIDDVVIRRTNMVALPVLVNGVSASAEDVGDGIEWGYSATVIMRDVTVGPSARVPILINGDVGEGSSIERLRLVDGDDVVGIVHQNRSIDGETPMLGEDVPEPTTSSDELYAMPDDCFMSCPP
jgi:hypothetical protein